MPAVTERLPDTIELLDSAGVHEFLDGRADLVALIAEASRQIERVFGTDARATLKRSRFSSSLILTVRSPGPRQEVPEKLIRFIESWWAEAGRYIDDLIIDAEPA